MCIRDSWNTHEIRRANGDTSNSQVLFLSTDGVNEPRGVALSYSSSVTCYLLTRSHSGQGDDPVASPNKSTGCSNGQYVAGESITLTATPATGWSVSGWSGTNNDASTSTTNSVTMPAANHAVSVAYVQTGPTCFTLTRNHTGQGNNPTAAPGKSTECGTGQYVAGENITLTASPTTGWSVAGWSGTNNDASTSTTNSVSYTHLDVYKRQDVNNSEGPESGNAKVIRGGGWLSSVNTARSAARGAMTPNTSGNYLGFRCAADAVTE